MFYKIVNKTKDVEIASSAKVASGFFQRLFGLMFRNNIKDDQALIFYQAPLIHTFFMRFFIDIVFLDKKMQVKRLVKSLAPWQFISCWSSYITIELAQKKVDQAKVKVGDKIEIIPRPCPQSQP
jgi:uncharacterized protein